MASLHSRESGPLRLARFDQVKATNQLRGRKPAEYPNARLGIAASDFPSLIARLVKLREIGIPGLIWASSNGNARARDEPVEIGAQKAASNGPIGIVPWSKYEVFDFLRHEHGPDNNNAPNGRGH